MFVRILQDFLLRFLAFSLHFKSPPLPYLCLLFMIVFLEGDIVTKTPTVLWMNVNGIGYEIHISLNTFEQIQDWEKGKLFISHQIKEDSETLYGFYSLNEKDLFEQLISVSGVGASTARMMLSGMTSGDIQNAILRGDSSLLQKIKGIGGKTAERIILELKDKMLKSGSTIQMDNPSGNVLTEDALYALISLGIARNTANLAIQKATKKSNYTQVEDLIKNALKEI